MDRPRAVGLRHRRRSHGSPGQASQYPTPRVNPGGRWGACFSRTTDRPARRRCRTDRWLRPPRRPGRNRRRPGRRGRPRRGGRRRPRRSRRRTSRVSDRPKPSVPSEMKRRGIQRATWSGTERMKSVTATMGPPDWASGSVTNGTRCGLDRGGAGSSARPRGHPPAATCTRSPTRPRRRPPSRRPGGAGPRSPPARPSRRTAGWPAAAPEAVADRSIAPRPAEPVHAPDGPDADPLGLGGVGGQGGHRVVLVVEGEVPVPVLGIGTGHPADPVLDDGWPPRRRRPGRRRPRSGPSRPAAASARPGAGAPRR